MSILGFTDRISISTDTDTCTTKMHNWNNTVKKVRSSFPTKEGKGYLAFKLLSQLGSKLLLLLLFTVMFMVLQRLFRLYYYYLCPSLNCSCLHFLPMEK